MSCGGSGVEGAADLPCDLVKSLMRAYNLVIGSLGLSRMKELEIKIGGNVPGSMHTK